MVIFPWWSMSPGVTVATRPRDCAHGNRHFVMEISVTRRYHDDQTTWLCMVTVISSWWSLSPDVTMANRPRDCMVMIISSWWFLSPDVTMTTRPRDIATIISSLWYLSPDVTMATWPRDRVHGDRHLAMVISVTRRYYDDQTARDSLRPSTLPLGHGRSPQYWIITVNGEETFFFFETWEARVRFEPAISDFPSRHL